MDDNTNKYIKSQSMAAGPVTLRNLVCKDCIYRNEELPVSFCDVFKKGGQRKPNDVLLGRGCPEYVKEKQ